MGQRVPGALVSNTKKKQVILQTVLQLRQLRVRPVERADDQQSCKLRDTSRYCENVYNEGKAKHGLKDTVQSKRCYWRTWCTRGTPNTWPQMVSQGRPAEEVVTLLQPETRVSGQIT